LRKSTIFIREEKLARDFNKMHEKMELFSLHNIKTSEQEHMDAVLKLIKYGIPTRL
jgi:hypothetical protein